MADPGIGARMALAPAFEAEASVCGSASSSRRSVCALILVADGRVIVQGRGEIDDDHSVGAFAAELTEAREVGTGVVLVDLGRCVHLGAGGWGSKTSARCACRGLA